MATINGVTFNMRNLRPVAVHRNSISEQPGSDTNFITDMGYDGLVLRLEGFEETLATYDSVISEFMKSGEQTLVHRTGWQFKVYSVQLTPELIAGFADNYFPYDLILYTSTPYRESTTLSCRAKAITSNNQEWSAEDMACSLVSNWSFEDWSNGTSSAPDGWALTGAGASIARSATYKHGTYSAAVTRAGANTYLAQALDHEFYRGKTITIGAWVKASVATQAVVRIDDGVSTTNSSWHTGGGDWEWLTATQTIHAESSSLTANFSVFVTDGTANVDALVVQEGTAIADNTFIRDIDTDGSVDAVPDIQITGGVGSVYEVLSPNPISEPGFETITDWTYSEVDPYNALSGGQNSVYPYAGTYSYEILVSTQLAIGNYGKITQNIDLGLIDRITFKHRCITLIGHPIIKFRVLAGSTVLASYDTPADYTDTGWLDRSIDIASTEQTLSFQIYCAGGAALSLTIKSFIDSIVAYKKSPTKDPVIYNTSDTTVKCAVANEVLDGAIHRINVDGTGTIDFDDDFSTGKWSYTCTGLSGVTHDTTNDELDIADDGYIYWKCDAKGPVTGIPTLTSQINITTGTPTIQISTDASTWYDITTAIVDDVDTAYELDSSSLHLKGQTLFYWRFDCVKAGAATCSIKSFELDINIVTIDFENPKITPNGANTFRCDQDAASGIECEISLIYRDRSWPA